MRGPDFVLHVTKIGRVRRHVAVAGALAIATLGTAGQAQTAAPPTLLCKLPPNSSTLPPTLSVLEALDNTPESLPPGFVMSKSIA